jgi:hypothetical protein
MILKTVDDLIREYNRRTALGTVHHECGDDKYSIPRGRHYKIQTGSKVYIVPGTDYDTLPHGYFETKCPNCQEVFPAIDFEEIEYPGDEDNKDEI